MEAAVQINAIGINAVEINIAGRHIGPGRPAYVIAEMSGNHNQSFEQAVKIVPRREGAGADAVKLQTYTADTITLRQRPTVLPRG